jgi:hypothetical protein
MPLERELMRSAMLESLRRQPPQQFVNFQHHVAAVLAERGFPVEGGHQPTILRQDERQFLEILFQFINQGILLQAVNSNNAGWPWLGLTQWGEQYVQGGEPDAYDPDGYLATLERDAPLDEIERRYLSQASAAFRADLPDAAAVMLGAASEHLLLQLAAALENADPSATKIKKAIDGGPALRLLRELQRYLEPKRSQLPRALNESLDTTFGGVASVVRASRNDGGHPALPAVDRDTVYVLLRLFPSYRRWVLGVVGKLPF